MKQTEWTILEKMYLDHILKRMIKLCKTTDKILDFGCGRGYLKKNYPAFNITNYDIKPSYSEVDNYMDADFDTVIANHVLEHLERDELNETLTNFKNKNISSLIVGLPIGGKLSRFLLYLLKTKTYRQHKENPSIPEIYKSH